jgi:hypothetical protein
MYGRDKTFEGLCRLVGKSEAMSRLERVERIYKQGVIYE